MKIDCNVIRDLLPLYADNVCSEESRRLVNEHLPQCAECVAVLEQLRTSEIEAGLKDEKDEVIRYQAKRFRRRSATVGSVVSGIFMVPILVCLIVNLVSGSGLDWFFIVLAGLAVAASLIIVPLTVPENKLLWTFCAFCASLMVLLGVCALVTHGSWFFTAASAALFGLSVVFLPFVLRAKPIRKLTGDFNRWVIVLAADLILFANMMNMITLRTKSFFTTLLVTALCFGGGWLLATAIRTKKEESV